MKFYIQVILLFSLLAFECKAQEKKTDIFKLQKNAIVFFNDNDFENSISTYKQLIKLDSLNSEYYFQYGVCLFKSGKKINSIPYFEKAEILKNKNLKLFYYLGVTNHLKHNFDTAIKYFEILKDKFRTENIVDEQITTEINKYIIQCNVGKTIIKKPLDIKIENLGPKLNSEYPEYIPLISSDEKTIFFTTRRPLNENSKKDLGDNLYFEDVYTSIKSEDVWQTPVPIKGKINTINHDACVSLNHNESILYIYKERSSDVYYSLYNTKKSDWSEPEPLNENINTKYWEPSAYESNYDSTMYFSSNKPGGYGGLDLYKSQKINGEWGAAVNLGSTINTSEDEDAPYIHPENHALYFSSKGHNNMGGYDFFIAQFDNKLHTWSTPENIGYPLNSAGDDIYFSWNKELSSVYFSSVREDSYGDKDIYKATSLVKNKAIETYADKIKIKESLNFNGKIVKNKFDKTEKPIIYLFHPNHIVVEENRDTVNRFSYKSLPNDNHQIVFESKVINIKVSAQTPIDTNTNNFNPLSEVFVYLLNSNNEIIKQTKSNENGFFKFDNLTIDNNYKLAFSKINNEPQGKVLLKSSKSVSGIVSLKEALISSHIIYGKIEPNHKEYTKIILNNGKNETITNINGYYAFTNLDNETYKVTLENGENIEHTNVLSDSCLYIAKKALPKFKFNKLPIDSNVIALNFEIHGKIKSIKDNENLNDISLLLINLNGEIIEKTHTNNEGLFLFKNLKYDNYYVLFEQYNRNLKAEVISLDDISQLPKNNFYSSKNINHAYDVTIKADSLQALKNQNNLAKSSEYVIGKIDYLNTKKSASNLITYLLNHNNELISQTKTNNKGEFCFKNLPALDYKIAFPGLNQKIKTNLIYALSDNNIEILENLINKKKYIVYGNIFSNQLYTANNIYLINNQGSVQSTFPNTNGYYAFIKINNSQNNLVYNFKTNPNLQINSTIDYVDNCLVVSKLTVSKFKYHKLLNEPNNASNQYILNGSITSVISTEILNDISILLIDELGNIVDKTRTNKNGKFKFHKLNLTEYILVLETKNNKIKIQLSDSYEDENEITLFDGYKSILKNKIYFDYNSYEINEENNVELNKIIAEIIKINPIKINIYCYADPIGSSIFNFNLSKNRGQSIKTQLDLNRITNYTIIPMGSRNCKLKTKDIKLNQVNRRVEFELIR